MQKSIYSLVALLILILLSIAALSQSKVLSPEQKNEKCRDIQDERIGLQVHLAGVDERISQAWPDKQIEKARTDMVVIKNFRRNSAKGVKMSETEKKKFYLIAHLYNFKENDLGCDEISFYDDHCTEGLEKFLIAKINTAVSLKDERGGLPGEKKKLENQILGLQSKLAEWGCELDPGGCHSSLVTGKFIIHGDPTGILVLTQSGKHVTGRYGSDEKSLKNTLSGDFDECNNLAGIFTNHVYKVTGTFRYSFSPDGSSYTGTWKNDIDKKTGKTSGQRSK